MKVGCLARWYYNYCLYIYINYIRIQKMKVKCSQSGLAQALTIVNRAVSPNNTLPVLNNILLKSENGKLLLSATNLEIAIQASIDANVEKDGSLTVPAKIFSAYVPLLSNEELVLVAGEGNTLEIKSKDANTKMKGISSEEFPVLPKLDGGEKFNLPAETLRKAIDQVAFVASTNISRPVLTGTLWILKDKKLKIVATDSYRLAEKIIDVENEGNSTFIVPGRTAQELSKILGSAQSKEISLHVTKNQIAFEVDGVSLTSRLIEGNFPDYEKILPKESKTKAKIKVDEFVSALKKVSVIVKENNNSIKILLDAGKISMSTEKTQIGEGVCEFSLEMEGDKAEVALNVQYLIDALARMDDDYVNFGLNDALSPVILSPAKPSGYTHIIMPLKV